MYPSAINYYYRSSLSSTLESKIRKKENIGIEYEPVMIILENSAGGKNSLGSRFDELGLILDKLKFSSGETKLFWYLLRHLSRFCKQVMT